MSCIMQYPSPLTTVPLCRPSAIRLQHLHTLVLHPDNNFEVFIDNTSVRDRKLDDKFDFLANEEIKDPEGVRRKPSPWPLTRATC